MKEDLLNKLRSLKNEIRIGIIGMGAMGKGLLYQTHITPGFKCVAICDIKIDKAIKCAEMINAKYRVVSDLKSLNDSIKSGEIAICEDGNLISMAETVDVLIETSDSIGPAAKFAETALKNKKHLILMNAEIDLVFGPYFLQLANKNDVTYSSCDGDQHGVIKRIVDDIKLWGFELVMAGNMKGFLDRYANPTSIIPEADKRNLSYQMCASYTDGTKLNIEMALVANALGLYPTKCGMHGPRAKHVREVFQLFDFKKLWDGKKAFVDYVLGAEPDGGVFVIGHCNNDYQKKMLKYYKMGDGPFYLFYRPYHLCHVEAMEGIANAVLDYVSLLKPGHGFKTNVFSFAKRDLKKGEKLDGIGGYCCYGMINEHKPDDANPPLPICLADKIILKRDIKKDEKICLNDVSFDPKSYEFDLYNKSLNIL